MPDAHNCNCPCHRYPGVIHVLPCCPRAGEVIAGDADMIDDDVGRVLRAAFGPGNEDMVQHADLVGAGKVLDEIKGRRPHPADDAAEIERVARAIDAGLVALFGPEEPECIPEWRNGWIAAHESMRAMLKSIAAPHLQRNAPIVEPSPQVETSVEGGIDRGEHRKGEG